MRCLTAVIELASPLIPVLESNRMQQIEYFVVRYQPDVVQENFINIGVVMVGIGDTDFGDARFLTNWTPVLSIDPDADTELLKECAADIGDQIRNRRQRRQILKMMMESFSNCIQLSRPRVCVCEDPLTKLDKLSVRYLQR